MNKQKEDYAASLRGLTDDELKTITESRIWLSAAKHNKPHSVYHWQAVACYREADRRGRLEIYTMAFELAGRASDG